MQICNCPFCSSDDIKYSVKTGNTGIYYISMYCRNCHCYGPRIRVKKDKSDYNIRYQIENSDELQEKAIQKWNIRPYDIMKIQLHKN